MVYRCPLDIVMLQMVFYYDDLCYSYDYQHLQALLFYRFDMDGASDVLLRWTYGVYFLIPSGFGHSKSIGAAGFQFQAGTGQIWVSRLPCSRFAWEKWK